MLYDFRGIQISNQAIVAIGTKIGHGTVVMPGAVIGRPPIWNGATIERFDPESLEPVDIGTMCVIGANAVIYKSVKIGDLTQICDNVGIREAVTIGSLTNISMGVTINANSRIGNNVKILDNVHITGNAIIEDDVFIGMLVSTANDNSMNRDPNKHWSEFRGPTIKRGARIGHGACINEGVTIGENALVGANAVVTKDVPDGATVIGIPAKIVYPPKAETDTIITYGNRKS